ncbi:hypothetical protein F2Q70_00010034 [Brassica cretica]|uniref:AtPDCT1/2 transmembrane domain-containing protein n=1 Tax=Brassica cretica TaxID=69181 RepID=A0A8S9LXM6_BRACR|nr:hypothetical protein F2Q70_00010034 [Brassica cretica]
MSTNTVVPLRRRSNGYHTNGVAFNGMENIVKKTDDCYTNGNGVGGKSKASFLTWTMRDAVYVARYHWIPCFFAVGVLFFMGVEYTLQMVPAKSEPFDIGFVATRSLNRVLASSPDLNTLLAALNTVSGFGSLSGGSIILLSLSGSEVLRTTKDYEPRAATQTGMNASYPPAGHELIRNALIVGNANAETGTRAGTDAGTRGAIGLGFVGSPARDFLGSGVDFPVGNVSFFLFYSGHVAGSMIASLDMRRMQRLRLAMLFDILNILQSIRLLGTRGHYTIDLAVGVGAGILFDSLAGKYEEMMSKRHNLANGFSLISKDSLVN